MSPDDPTPGEAYIAQKRAEAREKLSRKQDDLFDVEDMPQVGATVRLIETGEMLRVVGHKRQGSGRGFTLTVRPLDSKGLSRNVRPWSVEVVEADEQ